MQNQGNTEHFGKICLEDSWTPWLAEGSLEYDQFEKDRLIQFPQTIEVKPFFFQQVTGSWKHYFEQAGKAHFRKIHLHSHDDLIMKLSR